MSNDFYSGIYNPDVLSCLANLSNDEVFTPPEVANSMLDMLPQELFSDPNKFGIGKVIELSRGYVTVRFEQGEKRFLFPNAFESGFLKVQ